LKTSELGFSIITSAEIVSDFGIMAAANKTNAIRARKMYRKIIKEFIR
jgi:hypothetical protein